jgi:hypothetical protein
MIFYVISIVRFIFKTIYNDANFVPSVFIYFKEILVKNMKMRMSYSLEHKGVVINAAVMFNR